MDDAGFMFSILWLLVFSIFFLITFFNVVIRKNYARCLKHKFITGVSVWVVVSTLFCLSRLWPSAVSIFFKIGCFGCVIAGIFIFCDQISRRSPTAHYRLLIFVSLLGFIFTVLFCSVLFAFSESIGAMMRIAEMRE
jgi:hypothetical protein